MPAGKPLAIDWYDTPRWYDIVFAPDTRLEADFLEAISREHGPTPRNVSLRVLEPACGSGRLVAEMAARGHAVTGFDLNTAMLAHARSRLERRGLRGRVVRGDMASFRLRGRFELAHCLVSSFKYLLDEESARAHLACVARHLVPGGLYVLGFHLTDYDHDGVTQERWVESSRGVRVTCTTRVWPADRRARLEDVRTRLVVERAGGPLRRVPLRTETRWRFRTYDERQVRRLFATVPELEWIALHDFHYDAGRPRRIADGGLDCVFVLRRRAR